MPGPRELLFSVTLADCEVQHFRAGGPGGQNQNKRDTATRIIHHPSGARGESREHRTQHQNDRAAMQRLSRTPQFRFWVAEESKRRRGERSAEDIVEQMMADPSQFRVEGRVDGRWTAVEA